MNSENMEMLKKLTEDTIRKMTFDDFSLGAREETGPDGESIVFNIVTKDSDLIIGQHGANLRALQHILRAMARKKTSERLRFSVDVNDYRRQKLDSLSDLARGLARQAISDKRPVVMRPMGAFERRIVHMELSQNSQVKTESIGEGEERKVVIKPVGSIEQNDDFKTS